MPSSTARTGAPRPWAPSGGGLTVRAWTAVGIAGLSAVLALVIVTATASGSRAGELFLVAIAVSLVAIVVGNPRRFLLCIIVFDVALQWDVNLRYQLDSAKLGAMGGLNLSITTVALVGLYAIWFSERGSDRPGAGKLRVRPGLPLLLYIGIAGISAFVARDAALSLDELVLLVQTFLLFVYVASAIRTRSDLRFIVGALLASLVLQSLFVIWLRVTGSVLHLPGLNSQSYDAVASGPGGGGAARIGGTVGAPNATAAYLSMLLAPAIATALSPVGRRLRLLGGIAFGLGTIALILTFSRGGWLAFAVSMSILAYAGWRRGLFRARAPILLALTLLLLAVPFLGEITRRLDASDGGAAHSRVPLIWIAKHMIDDHPLLGVGLNNMAVRLPDYATPESQGFLYVVHNQYLLIWVESGLIALLAFLWFLGATLRRGWRCAASGDGFVSFMGVAFFAAILGHMAHMLVDLFSGRPLLQLLWLMGGILVAMTAMVDRETSSLVAPP